MSVKIFLVAGLPCVLEFSHNYLKMNYASNTQDNPADGRGQRYQSETRWTGSVKALG
jgi:hypothetical protein